jgi:pantoate--beta-alanine ligase
MQQSLAENDTTVVSIFVNPTQFNNLRIIKIPKNIRSRYRKIRLSTDIIFYALL